MILNLRRLLLPQRLAGITSIEMLLNVNPFNDAMRHQSNSSPISFASLCDAMSTTFPRLRKLYISLQGPIYPSFNSDNEITRDTELYLLDGVDKMVRHMAPHLKKFWVALPYGLYDSWQIKMTGIPVKHDPSNVKRDRVWRELRSSPGGPEGHISGYWILLGHVQTRDYQFMWMRED